jgi:chromosome partitioning protein
MRGYALSPRDEDGILKETYVEVNQKGGVGKTSLTLNLSAAVAATGARALMMDIDPQATLTLLTMRPSADTTIRGTAALLASSGAAQISDVRVRLDKFGCDLVPAEPRRGQPLGLLDKVEHELALEPARLYDLGDRIVAAADDYDYVFIDAPPNRGPLTQSALYAATRALVPLDCGPGSIEGLGDLLGTLRSVERINAVPIAAFVLIGFKAQTNEHRGVAEALAKAFPDIPRFTIRDTVKAQVAERTGVPLLAFPSEPVNKDYAALAAAIVGTPVSA